MAVSDEYDSLRRIIEFVIFTGIKIMKNSRRDTQQVVSVEALEGLVHGDVGNELIILAKPELRQIEFLSNSKQLKTLDGFVQGRRGDYVVSTTGGEQYPILASVFLGAYQIVGRVKNHIIAKRLIHVRRAWPIISNHAEFNYGDDRGTVRGLKNGWIYQSDDNDFGLVNREEKEKGHVVVGPASTLHDINWRRRKNLLSNFLTSVSPILTLLALLAFAAYTELNKPQVATVLLSMELALLALTLAVSQLSSRNNWSLKAAAATGDIVASKLQVAAEILGQSSSSKFPGMTLWRAAQLDVAIPTVLSSSKLRELKTTLSDLQQNTFDEVAHYARAERISRFIVISTISIMISLLIYLLAFQHHWQIELVAIWLPSVVGAVHAFDARKKMDHRAMSARSFFSEIKFVGDELYRILPNDSDIQPNSVAHQEVTALIKALCKFAGDYSQNELELSIQEKLPVVV